MKICTILIAFCLLTIQTSHAQEKRFDKINWVAHNAKPEKKPFYRKIIAPTILGTASLISISYKHDVKAEIQKQFPGFHTKVDDFFPLIPASILGISDLARCKARHSIWNQSKLIAISQLATTGIVLGLKNTTKVLRPDSSTYNSFPSGHTAITTVFAQALYLELRDTYPILAYSGHLVTLTTACFRMLNNRHWISDVLMGAGIGILVTNMVYHFEPLKDWNPFPKGKNVSLLPSFQQRSAGLYLSIGL